MSIEAMKQAIEAWDACGRYPDTTSDIERLDVAINTLRNAIQQAQQPATGEPVNGPHCTTCGASMDEPHHPACGALTAVIIGVNTMAAQDDRQRRRFLAKKIHQTLRGAITHPAPSVPDGYALVPIEPTQEMLLAYTGGAVTNAGFRWCRHQWSVMLAAAPATHQDMS